MSWHQIYIKDMRRDAVHYAAGGMIRRIPPSNRFPEMAGGAMTEIRKHGV